MKQRTRLTFVGVVLLVLSAVALLAASRSARFRLSESSRTTQSVSNQEPSHSPQPATPSSPGPIDRSVIAGGGGRSTGGSFTLDGTVGEVGASNSMSGGQYSVSGGYWNAVATASTGTPTPTPTPTPSPTPTPASSIQFSTANYTVNEGGLSATISVIRSGDTTGGASVDYSTNDVSGTNACGLVTGAASARCDYITALGTLVFAPNETAKTITVLVIDDAYFEGTESLGISLSNPAGAALGPTNVATISIIDNDSVNGTTNPLDTASFFVRQHYLDFLNREPDAGGLSFWTNEITSCGADVQCIDVKRINVSAAFFLSIEFQETGYLVYRVYKSAFGNLPGAAPVPVRFTEFLRDTQQIGQGVQVGIGNWQQQLEANKQAYVLQFVQRPQFLAAYPNLLSATDFVSQMNTNTGGVLSAADQANLIALLGTTPSDITKRAAVLRAAAENDSLRAAEFNKAFVMMQYFGYLRRNPNDLPDTDFAGFNFWLGKLNTFGGNFINAEMVKAFIQSIEYRRRFAP